MTDAESAKETNAFKNYSRQINRNTDKFVAEISTNFAGF